MQITRTLVAFLLVSAATAAAAQSPTVGLLVNDEQACDGFTLYGPSNNTAAYLLDNGGLKVHEWETGGRPRSNYYLLPDGLLLRAGPRGPGIGVRLQKFDWDGNLVWEYTQSNSVFRAHHDVEPLPNGNVLFINREIKSSAEAIAAGRDPSRISEGDVRPDGIVEIQPIPPNDGVVVWRWSLWDHLVQDFDLTQENYGVVADHPELVDINYAGPESDWIHMNSVAYDAELDQIIVSSRKFNEFWVIDHSTTIEEAAGHSGGLSGKGGDLLYRWGNPEAYGRGTQDDQQLYGQHDATRIPPGYPGAGNFLVFDNGWGGDLASTVEEVVPPLDGSSYTIEAPNPFAPAAPVWFWGETPPQDFYSATGSGAQRLWDGNTIICDTDSGRLLEVTAAGEIVWDYINPVGESGPAAQGDPAPGTNHVFKVRKYAADYPGFAGQELAPGDPIESFQAPLPVPAGTLRVSRSAGPGINVEVVWDAASCTSWDYHLLYGPLSGVTGYELTGAECNLGTTGSHLWTDLPAESLYFLIVGTDESGVYESSAGRSSAGEERGGTTASFLCGTTTRVVSSTCP